MLTTPRSPSPRALVRLLALLAAAATMLPAGANAAEGHAPPPVTKDVVADTHTDAIATFYEDDALVLGSKVDEPGGEYGVRYDNETTWFHVDQDSRFDGLPAGFEFIAPEGATVWIAPEVQDPEQIWPGFSTESVPLGALDGDNTTFTLLDVDGPGDVELWTSGAFGAANRLWSSDDAGYKSFTRGHVHMHANWAFTQPGIYELTVRADAAVSGAPTTDTAVYTFVVGDLPEDRDTTTTVTVSDAGLAVGEPVTLNAQVAPQGVEGAVEFYRGEHDLLGHDTVAGGAAELTIDDLAPGTHDIRAAFVPAVENLAGASTSDPVTVTVTDASGLPFALAGIEDSYQPGETLTAHVQGATLGANEEFQWAMRYQGTTRTIIPQSGGTSSYSQVVDALHDDAEIQVRIRDSTTNQTRSETAWVPIVVEHAGGQPVITQAGDAHDPLLPGDRVQYEVGGRPLAAGETLEWGFAGYAGYFPPGFSSWEASYPGGADQSRVLLTSQFNAPATGPFRDPLVVSVVKDGVRIARSEFATVSVGHRELNVSGHRNLYREGGRVDVGATVFPVRDADDFTYTWTYTNDGASEVWGTEQQPTAALAGPQLSKAQHDGGTLRLSLYNQGRLAQRSASLPISVTDDLTSQILEFNALAGHYHQGDQIALSLTVDPEPVAGDTVEWQWRWPGAGWTPMPGVEADAWRTTAEQALDGVEIRAVLDHADPAKEPLVSETRTIHVDDHGAEPRQQPSVGGTTVYTAGEQVTLARELPANGATILTDHRWERRAEGADTWTAVEGATGERLAFPATPADDGAQYRVAILKPTGAVAYGPSDPVTLTVQAAAAPAPDPTSSPTPDPTPSPTPDPTASPTPTPGAHDPATPRIEPIGRRRPGKGRTLAVARVTCPAGGPACRIAAPRRVALRIAGRRYRAVLRTRSIRPEARATVKIRLSRQAARRLRKHGKGRVAFHLRVTAGERSSAARVRVRLRR